MNDVDVELNVILEQIKYGTKNVCKLLKMTTKTMYTLIEFATRSKLNLIIVLIICGASYKNCPYTRYVFDFLISKSIPVLKWLGEVTGFNDAVLDLFTWLQDVLGITALLSLMQSIITMIPDAIATATAAATAGTTAATADIIRGTTDNIVQQLANNNAAAQIAAAAADGVAPGAIAGLLQGIGQGVGNTGLTLIVQGLVGIAIRGQQHLPQIGLGGRKRRRHTSTHKKRSKTKRRMNHNKRRLTKKRHNKRTKSRTKQ